MEINEKSKVQNGLTLIELLVAVAILGTVGVTAVIILFTTLRSSTKADILREVKQNGDYAISVMERMIRNATKITSTCGGSSQQSLTIKNPDGGTTQFSLSGTQIASSGGLLTNNKVSVANPPGLSFICSRVSGRPDVVIISFTLAQAGTITGVEQKASMDFKTTVSLRTY